MSSSSCLRSRGWLDTSDLHPRTAGGAGPHTAQHGVESHTDGHSLQSVPTPINFVICLSVCVELESHSVSQAGFELTAILPLSPQVLESWV